MRTRYCHGMTLSEMLVVITLLSLVMCSIMSITLQVTRVFGSTVGHVDPQDAQVLAFKRMEKDIRQAMAINVSESSPIRLQIVLPLKNTNGLNQITEGSYENIGLQPGHIVTYFLGEKINQSGNPNSWTATPSDTGDTIFKVTDVAPEQANNTNASIVIEGVSSQAAITNNNGTTKAMQLFTLGPTDTSGELYADPNLIIITFSMPVSVIKADGKKTREIHAFSTQLFMRNVKTSQDVAS